MTSVVIVIYSAVAITLAEAGHIATVVVMTGDTVAASLAEAGHNASAVVVTGDTVGSALAETFTHLVSLFSYKFAGKYSADSG